MLRSRLCRKGGEEGSSRCTSMVSSFHDTVWRWTHKYNTVLERRINPTTARHLWSSCGMQSTFGSNNGWRSGNSTIGNILSLSNTGYYQMTRTKEKVSISIRRRVSRFHYDPQTKTLYRKSYDGVLLRCLSDQDAEKVIQETHAHFGP